MGRLALLLILVAMSSTTQSTQQPTDAKTDPAIARQALEFSRALKEAQVRKHGETYRLTTKNLFILADQDAQERSFPIDVQIGVIDGAPAFASLLIDPETTPAWRIDALFSALPKYQVVGDFKIRTCGPDAKKRCAMTCVNSLTSKETCCLWECAPPPPTPSATPAVK